jgi:ParB family chromosome partitioning protein
MKTSHHLSTRITNIALKDLHPSPYQPRQHLEKEHVKNLARSIKHHGLLEPVLVQRDRKRGGYTILAGHMRVEAFRLLNRSTIPAIDLGPKADPAEIPLVENLLRVNLTPMERAEAIAKLIKVKGYTQDEAAKRLDQSQESVSQLLGLLHLPTTIRQELRTRRGLTLSLLVELAACKDEAVQTQLWRKIESGTIRTVKELRAAKKAPQRPAQSKTQPRTKQPRQSTKIPPKLLTDIRAAAKQLRRCTGSRTVIRLLKDLEQRLHKA